MTPREERRAQPFCGVHSEYIESIAILNNNIQWLTKLGKWVVGTLVTASLVVCGAVGTFAYKANEAYGQIQKNTAVLELIMKHEKKEQRIDNLRGDE